MQKFRLILLLGSLGIVLISLSSLKTNHSGTQSAIDSLKADRAKHIELIKEKIKGKEQLPADSVFENIQILKSMPAGRMLAIMDIAYSQSLGVSCGHCHDTRDFSSEIKPEKQIAREMWLLAGKTREMLKNIEGLKSDNPMVNCTTCHRGKIKPALNLD